MVGRDTGKYIHGLDSFQKLTRRSLYPGIDLVLYGNSRNQLEYDLIVAPGADPSWIPIKVEARIDPKTGDLLMRGACQHKPVISQNNKTLDGRFRQVSRNTFGFEIAPLRQNPTVTIDPIIEFREYIGGIGDDSVTGVDVYNQVTGTTNSITASRKSIRF